MTAGFATNGSAGELIVDFDSEKHRERICELIERYAPMEFADACLFVMAEVHHPATVVTIDRHADADAVI